MRRKQNNNQSYWGCLVCFNRKNQNNIAVCDTCGTPKALDKYGLRIVNNYYVCKINSLVPSLSYMEIGVNGKESNYKDLMLMLASGESVVENIRNTILHAKKLQLDENIAMHPLTGVNHTNGKPTENGGSLFHRVLENAMNTKDANMKHSNHGTNGYASLMIQEQEKLSKLVKDTKIERLHGSGDSHDSQPNALEHKQKCGLCEHLFPIKQLLGNISFKTIVAWKESHHVKLPENDRRLHPRRIHNPIEICIFCSQFFLDHDMNIDLLIDPTKVVSKMVGMTDKQITNNLENGNKSYKSVIHNALANKKGSPQRPLSRMHHKLTLDEMKMKQENSTMRHHYDPIELEKIMQNKNDAAENKMKIKKTGPNEIEGVASVIRHSAVTQIKGINDSKVQKHTTSKTSTHKITHLNGHSSHGLISDSIESIGDELLPHHADSLMPMSVGNLRTEVAKEMVDKTHHNHTADRKTHQKVSKSTKLTEGSVFEETIKQKADHTDEVKNIIQSKFQSIKLFRSPKHGHKEDNESHLTNDNKLYAEHKKTQAAVQKANPSEEKKKYDRRNSLVINPYAAAAGMSSQFGGGDGDDNWILNMCRNGGARQSTGEMQDFHLTLSAFLNSDAVVDAKNDSKVTASVPTTVHAAVDSTSSNVNTTTVPYDLTKFTDQEFDSNDDSLIDGKTSGEASTRSSHVIESTLNNNPEKIKKTKSPRKLKAIFMDGHDANHPSSTNTKGEVHLNDDVIGKSELKTISNVKPDHATGHNNTTHESKRQVPSRTKSEAVRSNSVARKPLLLRIQAGNTVNGDPNARLQTNNLAVEIELSTALSSLRNNEKHPLLQPDIISSHGVGTKTPSKLTGLKKMNETETLLTESQQQILRKRLFAFEDPKPSIKNSVLPSIDNLLSVPPRRPLKLSPLSSPAHAMWQNTPTSSHTPKLPLLDVIPTHPGDETVDNEEVRAKTSDGKVRRNSVLKRSFTTEIDSKGLSAMLLDEMRNEVNAKLTANSSNDSNELNEAWSHSIAVQEKEDINDRKMSHDYEEDYEMEEFESSDVVENENDYDEHRFDVNLQFSVDDLESVSKQTSSLEWPDDETGIFQKYISILNSWTVDHPSHSHSMDTIHHPPSTNDPESLLHEQIVDDVIYPAWHRDEDLLSDESMQMIADEDQVTPIHVNMPSKKKSSILVDEEMFNSNELEKSFNDASKPERIKILSRGNLSTKSRKNSKNSISRSKSRSIELEKKAIMALSNGNSNGSVNQKSSNTRPLVNRASVDVTPKGGETLHPNGLSSLSFHETLSNRYKKNGKPSLDTHLSDNNLIWNTEKSSFDVHDNITSMKILKTDSFLKLHLSRDHRMKKSHDHEMDKIDEIHELKLTPTAMKPLSRINTKKLSAAYSVNTQILRRQIENFFLDPSSSSSDS